jgi:hypothetical protein
MIEKEMSLYKTMIILFTASRRFETNAQEVMYSSGEIQKEFVTEIYINPVEGRKFGKIQAFVIRRNK